jgi:hypothetical protein
VFIQSKRQFGFDANTFSTCFKEARDLLFAEFMVFQ